MVICTLCKWGRFQNVSGNAFAKHIQHILLEQEACTGHRDTFKLACNRIHGCVLIEEFLRATTVTRHEGDVDLNVLT